MKQYAKAVFTFANGEYERSVNYANVVTENKEWITLDINHIRSQVPAESIGSFSKGLVPDSLTVFQRAVVCNEDEVDRYERSFLDTAYLYFSGAKEAIDKSLKIIEEKE